MIERLISIALRTGVLLSMAVIVIGVALTFVHHPDYFRSRPALGELTSAGATYPHTIRAVASDARQGHGQAIAMVGILLLIATPIVRVALSTALFAVEKDKLYAGITLVVLILLLVSLLTGLT
jgi:uncharacterized membrane protein